MARFSKAGDIRIGTIGYSSAFNMGRAHLADGQKFGMVPTAVCELNPERREAARQDFPGIETYSDLDEMLAKSDVNLIAIITPHNTHYDLALKCLRAGRHVVVEKPFALTTEECDEMIAAAEQRNLVVTAYHNRHWNGCIMQAVKAIRSGAIGEVVHVDAHMGSWGKPREWWRSSKSISGGILYDWGAHLLDYTFQILQADMAEVSGFVKAGFWAQTSPWGADANEDDAFVTIRYTDGRWSTLGISSLDSRPRQGWVQVVGTEGSYWFDYHSYEITRPDHEQTLVTRGKNPPTTAECFYENLASHLVDDVPLVISPQWSRRPVHVIDLAQQSAAQGRTLAVKYA